MNVLLFEHGKPLSPPNKSLKEASYIHKWAYRDGGKGEVKKRMPIPETSIEVSFGIG